VTRPASTGEIVTYRGDVAIGHESYRDDGDTLVSDIRFGGRSGTITISRAKRHVRVEAAGNTVESDIPEGTVALENGQWAAYAIAAQWFSDAATPTPVKVLLPTQGMTLDATITVTPTATGGKKVAVALKGIGVVVELDAAGTVIHASVPAQGLEVRRAEEAPPVVEARPAPATVTSEPFEVIRGGVTLRGELWLPKGATGKVPVVLVIAGSGPTDRDGNSSLGLRSDAYRMLAEALAARGIASLRYDKRGVGMTGAAPEPVPDALAPLFNPTVRAMVRSLLEVDPAALLQTVKVRTAIIQGEHDAQVRVADARALARAQPDARLTLLPAMNHVFKEEASATLPQTSYTDPSRPLAAGFVDAVVAAVVR
jgi:hypothetical protein